MSGKTARERLGHRRRIFQRRHGIQIATLLRFLPDRSGAPPVPPPWPPFEAHVPAELLDLPGERRNPDEERQAAASAPLHEFFALHHEAAEFMVEHGMGYIRPVIPRFARALHRLRAAARVRPAAVKAAADPAELTAAVRAEAARLGISRIGIAKNDPLYTFADSDAQQFETVIVCVQEQDWEMTQTAPSNRAEVGAFHGYVEGLNRSSALSEFLKARGYRTVAQGPAGDAIAIHYAVASGLGQLGLNGQLLTPQAGSRCRLLLLTTQAPLVCDEPVDHGLHGVCDECRACVRNCPVGAIPQARRPYRGVEKAKLNTERCLPIVLQVSGCAICMKVCPVQRYGLAAILEHRERTGEILGTGSDELEGYDWPLDGRHYGPGETPRVEREVLRPPNLLFDPQRREPPPGIRPTTFVGDIPS